MPTTSGAFLRSRFGGKDSFYDADHENAIEATRLRRIAGTADQVSLSSMGSWIDRPSIVVADVGSGESTSLGSELVSRNPSLTYIPIDIRPSALDTHRNQGFDGRVGSATDLPLADGCVDIVHARFVFVGLDPAGRQRAVEELMRVASSDAAMALVIDYDWGSAAGPGAVVAWKDGLLEVLSAFGFDPYYGQRLTVEMSRCLSEAGIDSSGYELSETRNVTTETMRQALPTIDLLSRSVTDRLVSLGLDHQADELKRLHTAVVDHGRRQPETALSLPTMVATTVDFRGAAAARVASTIGSWRARRRLANASSGLPHAGPPGLRVHRLESDDLVAQARRLHAAEYVSHRYHTEDSTDDQGFLLAEIDPPEVVARSTYLGVIDDEGDVAGCIRMIRPANNDPFTLPTFAKLASARCGTGSVLADLPFPRGSGVFEVSGLARSTRWPDRVLTTRLLLAVVCEARRCGDDFGVMGIVQTVARLLTAVYGPQAIRSLKPAVGTLHVTGSGIREGGVVLVPCYSETDTFVNDCLEHCLNTPGREFSRLNRPLIELAATVFAH